MSYWDILLSLTNSDHVLQAYLSDPTNIPYQLRNRSHNITLINKTKFLNDTDFIPYAV